MAPPSPEPEAPSPDPSEPGAQESAPADASKLWIVGLRDVAILAAAASLFAAADAWHILTNTTFSGALSLVDGLLVGLVLTGLVHEWGHYAGARWTGSRAPLRPARDILPLFDFDAEKNTGDQFLRMSIGGNVAHWLAFVTLWISLPLTTVGQVALVSSAFGFSVFASSIEFPVIGHARSGLGATEALARIPKDFLRRNGRYGLAAAFVAFLVL